MVTEPLRKTWLHGEEPGRSRPAKLGPDRPLAGGPDPGLQEHRVHRLVGVTFLALAAYVAVQAALTLWGRRAPEESIAGIVLAAASLVIMPLVSWWKLRAASEIQSAALRAEAKETLACSYLSFTLLVGLGANAVAGWWWADPVAALLMVPWLLREGSEGIRRETCGDRSNR